MSSSTITILAVAGFVRDYFEGSKHTKTLYKRAVKWKIIKEI